MTKLSIRTRKSKLFAPMRCACCDKEIVIGEQYVAVSGGYQYKLKCYEDRRHREKKNSGRVGQSVCNQVTQGVRVPPIMPKGGSYIYNHSRRQGDGMP